MSEQEDLRELSAYKIGYDLGWYRAHEALANQLAEIGDAIINSQTLRDIEKELGHKRPIFLAKILDLQAQIAEMRNEHMPTLLLERKEINRISSSIAKLPRGVFEELGVKEISITPVDDEQAVLTDGDDQGNDQ